MQDMSLLRHTIPRFIENGCTYISKSISMAKCQKTFQTCSVLHQKFWIKHRELFFYYLPPILESILLLCPFSRLQSVLKTADSVNQNLSWWTLKAPISKRPFDTYENIYFLAVQSFRQETISIGEMFIIRILRLTLCFLSWWMMEYKQTISDFLFVSSYSKETRRTSKSVKHYCISMRVTVQMNASSNQLSSSQFGIS